MAEPTGQFEFVDHTADLGVRVRAPTAEALVQIAVTALYATVGQVVTLESPLRRERLVFDATDRSLLLRDLLAALLRWFERGEVAIAVNILTFTDQRLTAEAHFAPLDRQRSDLQREVKAVTYHELSLRQTNDGYEAFFIVDI